ncbi:MAG: hypothetical protein EXS39_01765 [Opitutaceae bacterium]|nr:hypothetical protein [Opitutaceae bacterium]
MNLPTRLPAQSATTTPARPSLAAGGPVRRNAGTAGSVLVIVLVTVLFAAFALMAFMDKASTDLIVESRDSTARRLRLEAYSALEVTLAVLENFREANGALRSVTEGWGDPLAFASWTSGAGRTVEVQFEDESGKLPLPRADAVGLVALFEVWAMPQSDAERLADALMGWMKKDYMGSGTFTPDYDSATIPYAAPGRSLRSFGELAAIDVARGMFYDADGRPNELWRRFTGAVSLFNYPRPNLNSARPAVQAALGNFDPDQQQKLADFLAGTGPYQLQGPGYLRSVGDAVPVIGQVNTSGFDTQIRALRIRLTVHDGRAVYRLNVVVAPPNGATTVQSSASSNPAVAPASPSVPSGARSSPAGTAPAGSTATGTPGVKKLNYPFTVLEIRENDEPDRATPLPAVLPGTA